MSINFTTKSVKLTGALKAFTEEHLKGIEKLSGDIIDAEVIISEEKLNFKVEITVKSKLHSYHIEDSDPILKQAIRKTLNTLKAKAKKDKDKMKEKRPANHKFADEDAAGLPGAESADTSEKPRTDAIIISGNVSRKPLTIEEAIFFLKDSGDNAYLFTNVETNKMSVVYFNKDNKLAFIEAI